MFPVATETKRADVTLVHGCCKSREADVTRARGAKR
jgi:hypothetical protein